MAAATADLYLTGVCTQQLEPVWGGQQDTAMTLRSACGRGLVSMRHPDALLYLADALADPEAPVRLSAAQSLAYHGAETGLPVLRLKVLSGDTEVQVLGECMLAMLRIDTASSVAFVGQQLQHVAPERREVAALALGESRVEDALAHLVGWLPEARSTGQAEAALLSIAMLRNDAAMSFLLDQIASQPGPEAREALTAIGIHQRDATLRERVEEAAQRAEVDLSRDLEAIFPPPAGSSQ